MKTVYKIKKNKVMCLKCQDIVESTHRHDFRWCKCGAIAVDGGTAYLKRVGNLNSYRDMSEYHKCKECNTYIEYLSYYSSPNHPLLQKKINNNDLLYDCWYCPKCNKKV